MREYVKENELNMLPETLKKDEKILRIKEERQIKRYGYVRLNIIGTSKNQVDFAKELS